MPSSRFRINSPEVVAETLEGEVIVINLKTGTYYSLVDAGATTWQLLESGSTVEESIAAVRSWYTGDAEAIAEAISALVEALLAEELFVPRSPGDAAGATRDLPPPDPPMQPFVAPRLEPYIDMQNLIQLDPIHQTDAGGWPTTAAQ